jgi:NAD(P)-dependent dehydrogenase (short-subunit alcohol dehydrogenase family)
MTNDPRRVVLITGALSGIGRATAELIAARGHRVFGGVRAAATTRPLAGVELVPLDVRDGASVKACIEEVHRRAGRIDILINNAGVNLVGAVEETSISQAQALFDTNVFGVLRMIQAVLPGMRRQGSGLIVNLSSILGFIPAPFMGVYASTKHAIEGLSESLDHEVRAFGIRVVLIEPHYIRTNLDASACASGGPDRCLRAAAPTDGGSDHPRHQHGAGAEARRRGSVAIDRRTLPNATPDRPGISSELAAQAPAGPVVRAQPAQGIRA